MNTKQPHREPSLDAILDATECAKWLKITPRILSKLARYNEIPSFKVGRLRRFHPRTILAALQPGASK